MKRVGIILSVLFALTHCLCSAQNSNFRLLYWNIQNGMWDGQEDNYARFVDWVKSYDPDICVWCEGQSIYLTNTDQRMPASERYLTGHWDELALRYGHEYVYVGGYRDDYPQVITSRYPIENIDRIVGSEPDSIVCHGCGWAAVDVAGKHLNIVTLHLWPQKWTFGGSKQDADLTAGDRYRRMEIEYICRHTVLTHKDAAGEYWMMMGDHNARSRVDNAFYRYPEDDTRFLVHDYILGSTPYIDVIAGKHPGQFNPTMHSASRIDFIYMTKPLYDCVVDAEICRDYYVEPVRDAQQLSNFWHPSDHRPIIVDFAL